MSPSNWTADFLSRLSTDITVAEIDTASTTVWQIESRSWQGFAEFAMQQKLRWAAGWAVQDQNRFLINACFEKQGEYVLLRTLINDSSPELPSQATVYPAANRSERHTQDLFGIRFIGLCFNFC